MVNITKGNDFKLAATFTRGGETYKFDSVSAVNLLQGANTKYALKFTYADGKLTIYGSYTIPTGTYGIEVLGKEGSYQRRTAYAKVLTVTNNTTAGSYDPVDDIDDYDIGMHIELDTSADTTEASEDVAGAESSETESPE